jgi:hypothetical protein
MLNRVHPLHCPPAIIKHREVTLDPGERGKFHIWGATRHQDEVVPLPQRADDKGP